MFKCRGFRASFDFITGKQRGHEYDICPVSINGAYKTNKDEYYERDYTYNSPKRLVPSMVKLPKSQTNESMKPSKSTSDLVKTRHSKEILTRSIHDLSHRSNEVPETQIKEQKELAKQELLEQKRQEKIAAKERHRQEKRVMEKVKQERNLKKEKQLTENNSRLKKKSAPSPPQSGLYRNEIPANIQPQLKNQSPHQTIPNNMSQTDQPRQPYSTNTLESSISKSSGPPPYGEYPEISNDMNTGNITYGKPIDSSWDLISQHREQIRKPIASAAVAPRRRKDLQYSVGNFRMDNDNSEA